MVYFSILLIMPFFFNQTQLYTYMSVSALQQSESAIHICALVAQLCPTLCDPMDCNLPYSSVHVILQAKISHASKLMLKILQARLQQHVNHELPDVQAGFRKGRGTRDQIANIRWIMEKAREFQKNISWLLY